MSNQYISSENQRLSSCFDGNTICTTEELIRFEILNPASSPILLTAINPYTNQPILNEIPPSVINGARRNYFVGNFESFSCMSDFNFIVSHLSLPCSQVLAPLVDNSKNKTIFRASDLTSEPQYNRNYSGIFSVHQVEGSTINSSVLVSINHHENKGESSPYAGSGIGPFENTFAPSMKNLSAVNFENKPCVNEHAGCYFASISISATPYEPSSSLALQPFTELGPIVWPSAGYVSADGFTKVSNGPRHPYGIIKDGYLYVFYIDHIYSNAGAPGVSYVDSNRALDRGPYRSGLKVMRAQIPHFQPHQWKVYYNGDFISNALPKNLNPNNLKDYLSQKGPKATPLFLNSNDSSSGSSETLSFSVAKVKGQDLYIGAETYVDYQEQELSPNKDCAGSFKLALRVSKDLVHWTPRREIYGCLSRDYFRMNYARFYNEEATSNEEVDLTNFYIVGSGVDFKYNFLQIRGSLSN